MRCPVIELLTEIRDRLRNLDTLEERRAKDRERKRLVRGHKICPQTKEDEKGKETFPPAPPIEKRAKAEEKCPLSRAHARFVPPTQEEVSAFCLERKNAVDPVAWWNFYAAKGWMIGKSKMVDWRRAVITWERDRSVNGRTRGLPLDPKAAAFERQRAEAEERRRRAEALAASILERRRGELAGMEAPHD